MAMPQVPGVNRDQIDTRRERATLQWGTAVTIPKSEEAKPRQIEIKG
jgi:hypothetical protein